MGSREDRNIELAERLYATVGAGDWAAAEALLTDDFVARESPALPFAGEYRGRGGLRTLFDRAMGMLQPTGLDIKQLTAGGDWVIGLVDFIVADDAGGELRLSLAEAIRFRGEQVVEIVPFYFDPAAVHRAVKTGA